MSQDVSGEIPSLFGGLDWLKPPASNRTVQAPAPRLVLQPLSSNKPTAAPTTAVTNQFKRRTPATAVRTHVSQPGDAHALQQGTLPRQQQQQAAGQDPSVRTNHTSAQARAPLLALTTKPAAAAFALPSLKPLATKHQHAARPSKQHSSSPAPPNATAASLFDFPTDGAEDENVFNSQDQSPATAEAPCQLSTAQKNSSQTAARTQASKETAQQQQRGRFTLPQLDLFSNNNSLESELRLDCEHQHQQQEHEADAAGPWLAGGTLGLQLVPLKSFSRSSKQTAAGRPTKPSTAQHAARSLPGLGAATAATGRLAAALLPPLRPAAAAAGLGALLALPKPAAASTAAAGGHSRAWLGLPDAFKITSAEGELEFCMEPSDTEEAPIPAAACADSPQASLDNSQQQQSQQDVSMVGLQQEQEQLLLSLGRSSLAQGRRQQRTQQANRQQGSKFPAGCVADSPAMSHDDFDDDSNAMSQSLGSMSGREGQKAASSSSSDGSSGNGSDADMAAPASSGSLWSGSSGGEGSSSGGAGSGSDTSYMAAQRSGKSARAGRAAGNSRGREAGGVKHLLEVQRKKRGGAAGVCTDDAAVAQDSKRHKHVRFADNLEEFGKAAGLKQQQKQPGGLQDAQCVLGRVKKGSRGKAAACAAALDLGPVIPGEVPLLLQSVHSMLRSSVLLVELPACFDVDGDAGAIGRVVCSSAGHAVSDAHAVARVADRPKEQKPAARKRKAGTAAAAAATEGGSSSADEALSESESEVGTDNDTDSESDGQCSEGDDADARPTGVPALDLKGAVYEVRELLLAGTAAVVRINAAGKGGGGKPASAHMEHMFTSCCSATPAAALDDDDADAGYAAGFEYDWEGFEDVGDPLAVGADCGGDGVSEKTAGVGNTGKGAGRKGRGPAGGLAKGAAGAKRANGKAAAAGKRGGKGGVKKRATGKGRGAGKGGAGKGRAGAAAGRGKQAGAAGGKVGGASTASGTGKGSKQKQKDPWETDDDGSE